MGQESRKEKPDIRKLIDGPCLAGYTIKHNDAAHVIIVDNLLLRLTKMEYDICKYMLEAASNFQRRAAGSYHIALYEDLEQVISGPRDLLSKHIYNLNVKLALTGLTVVRVGHVGYIVVFSSKE